MLSPQPTRRYSGSFNHGLAAAWLDPVMLAITVLGFGAVQAAIAIVVTGTGFATKNAALRRIGCAALIAYAGSAIAQVIKHLSDRPRPVLVVYDARVPYSPLFTHSFPSGHAMTAFAAAFAYAAFLPRARYALIALASLVALSRVYLGVHFPLDVLYGALVGALVGIGSARIVRPRTPEPAK